MTGAAAMKPTRVVLADDQDLIRTGLRLVIDRAPGLTVVGEASTGHDAVRIAREARADVVLMDIRMPGLDGLAATRRIAADDSLAGVRVLILTTFEVDLRLRGAAVGGERVPWQGRSPGRPDRRDPHGRPRRRAAFAVSHPGPHCQVPQAARQRAVCASPLLAALTDREREVTALVADGMSNTEIAGQLTLSPLTVKTHVNHAMTKLGARDRAQLVVLAYQTGLARAPRPRP